MQIYLVGGAVRDQLLGLEVKDRDWVVVGATPEQMRALGYRAVGKDFPVFLNPDNHEEYALARTERKSGHGYQGFTFHTDPSVTLEEDLLRRDITINAMAIDTDGQLIDPYHGQDDLKARVLRHLSPAFAEDPLRVLRVARFAARFHALGFKVAPETRMLMQQISASGELEHLSAERVWSEFERSLQCDFPVIFLSQLHVSNALERLLPEFTQLDWHSATYLIEQLNRQSPSSEQRFALLCQQAFHNAEQATLLEEFCRRIKTPKRYLQAASDLLKWHDTLANFAHISSRERWHLIKSLRLLRQPERITLLLPIILTLHPKTAKDLPSRFSQLLQRLEAVSASHWADQGIKGKALGDAMEQAYLHIAEHF